MQYNDLIFWRVKLTDVAISVWSWRNVTLKEAFDLRATLMCLRIDKLLLIIIDYIVIISPSSPPIAVAELEYRVNDQQKKTEPRTLTGWAPGPPG